MQIDLSPKDKKAYNLIRNRLVHRGDKPTLKEINAVTGGKSPRSASIVIDRLIKLGLLKKEGPHLRLTSDGFLNPLSSSTTKIPLIGTVTCGAPILAQENIEAYFPISTELAPKGQNYFLLRASGNSMDLVGIHDGEILLVRQQSTADDGKKVVALIDDEATVKIFERKNGMVILRPRSSSSEHKPIILTNNFQILGEVLQVLPKDLS